MDEVNRTPDGEAGWRSARGEAGRSSARGEAGRHSICEEAGTLSEGGKAFSEARQGVRCKRRCDRTDALESGGDVCVGLAAGRWKAVGATGRWAQRGLRGPDT